MEIPLSVCVPHAQHYIHDSVDGCICSQAEVSSRNVVADGGWDDTHGDAQLLVVSSGFKQLQNTFIPLQKSNKKRTLNFSIKVLLIHFNLLEDYCVILYLKPSYYKQSWDVEVANDLHDIFHVFVWKRSYTGYEKKRKVFCQIFEPSPG